MEERKEILKRQYQAVEKFCKELKELQEQIKKEQKNLQLQLQKQTKLEKIDEYFSPEDFKVLLEIIDIPKADNCNNFTIEQNIAWLNELEKQFDYCNCILQHYNWVLDNLRKIL